MNREKFLVSLTSVGSALINNVAYSISKEYPALLLSLTVDWMHAIKHSTALHFLGNIAAAWITSTRENSSLLAALLA